MAISQARLCRVLVLASGGRVRRGAVYRQPQNQQGRARRVPDQGRDRGYRRSVAARSIG